MSYWRLGTLLRYKYDLYIHGVLNYLSYVILFYSLFTQPVHRKEGLSTNPFHFILSSIRLNFKNVRGNKFPPFDKYEVKDLKSQVLEIFFNKRYQYKF
jgi:hypothetical protein